MPSKAEEYLADIAKRLSTGKFVKAGFLEGAKYSDGTPVAMIAAIQEFGAPKVGIPPKSFMRPTAAKKKKDWAEQLKDALEMTNFDAEGALDLIGQVMAADITEAITEVTSPPLSDVTLLLRQRFANNPHEITFADVQQARRDIASGTVPQVTGMQAKPLVWTGFLLRSVDSEVVK